MKKLILSTIVLVMAGLSSAYAQDEAIAQEPTTEGVIQPYLRSCDSPYLGHNESCMRVQTHVLAVMSLIMPTIVVITMATSIVAALFVSPFTAAATNLFFKFLTSQVDSSIWLFYLRPLCSATQLNKNLCN